jgi:electron transport complex protein RnfG
MIRLTLVLALITFIAAVALGFVYQGAAPKIEEQRKITDERARRIALPQAACGVFVGFETDGFQYYKGYRNQDTTDFVGYTVKAEGQGYSSTIQTVVGVDAVGRITGMKITAQQETPGLGTRIEEIKSTKTVLDALREIWGHGKPDVITAYLPGQDGKERCFEVNLRDTERCGALEMYVASRDTLAAVKEATQAFGLAPEDSLLVFSDPAVAFGFARSVLDQIRLRRTPWFQQQFIGKRNGDLLLTTKASDRYIQAITGATISSAAVTESVRDAIENLEKAVGGFEVEKD